MPDKTVFSASDGTSALHVTKDGQIFISNPLQTTPVKLEIDGLKKAIQIAFADVYYILDSKNRVFTYYRGHVEQYKQTSELKVRAIGGYGSTLYIAARDGLYTGSYDGQLK